MFKAKFSVFSKTRELERQIDAFHDLLIDAAVLFHEAISVFLSSDEQSEYKDINRQIKKIEHDADGLRREIENQLYSQNLVPNLQADILQLIEGLDKINNQIDDVVYKFFIEQPEIPEAFHHYLIELCHQVADCSENMAMASRAFFKDLSSVRDYSHKVYLMEQQSDITYNNLKKAIFSSELPLANKLQLDSLITEVADIGDIAEDCADELLIFTIKRDV